MSRRLGVSFVLLLALAGSAAARPRSVIVDDPNAQPGRLTEQGLVPYNTIFLNKCAAGCPIRVGTSDSTKDTWPIGSNRTLTAWPYDDATWQKVVDCVKDVFEPYNVQITDVDPGTANHFEIMIAGSPLDVGMDANIGGVAPGSGQCGNYLNNALVFDFAKVWGQGTTCGASCIEDICSTAAQEIGHTWNRMDHVIVKEDPMTYFNSPTRKYFQNTAAICGSDCVNGIAPGNRTCTNAGGTNMQSHNCWCGATQNSHEVIAGLFGSSPGSPPTVTITDPKLGANVSPGFAVRSTAVDNSGIVTKVELRVDGQLVGMLTAPPFVFNAPDTLGNGTHKVEVTAYDPHAFVGTAKVDVVIGPPCESSSDCSTSTDACVGGRCVPGPGVTGGLGQPCTGNAECASGQCGSDGSSQHCVEACMVGDCPDGFGCTVPDGTDTGVCWPGFDDGSGGGCGCESNRGGPFGMLVLVGWLVLACRPRRRA